MLRMSRSSAQIPVLDAWKENGNRGFFKTVNTQEQHYRDVLLDSVCGCEDL